MKVISKKNKPIFTNTKQNPTYGICLVLNLTVDGNWAVLRASVFATGYFVVVFPFS